ncbi:hypothetical protein LO763_18605 [Glycomyces sp. A-F 0318]|uniref:hypothetical protein n=1 Tax=Glycomyces amatae TaxID=2881355 RepID=UPI001E529B05|nr:hypothetical protein [Glycomyces amatae]MCD0445621.1 hypothetical protein [Glycomyces amatae]
MLSALILLRHVSETVHVPETSTDARPSDSPVRPSGARLTDAQSRRAWALADFLQLYNPTELLAGPGACCAETLAPLAGRLDLRVTVADDLGAAAPKLPGPAHAAVWTAARALRALPDPRRTTVVCAESAVLAALLVAVAACDGHDLSRYEHPIPLGPDDPAALRPGAGWVLHRDDGLLIDVKPLAVR